MADGPDATTLEVARQAGLLASLLSDYLVARYNHLLLIYASPEVMGERLGEVAKEAAEESFYHFCNCLCRLDGLQREGRTNDGVLGTAGDPELQRMLNAFLLNLPAQTDEDMSTSNVVRDLDSFMSSWCSNTDGDRPGRRPTALDFMEAVRDGELLAKEYEAYKRWLSLGPPSLVIATELLSEFALRLHETIAVRWPGRLDSVHGAPTTTELSAAALVDYWAESTLPRPAGRVKLDSAKSDEPVESRRATRHEPRREERTEPTPAQQSPEWHPLEKVLDGIKPGTTVQIFFGSEIHGSVSARDHLGGAALPRRHEAVAVDSESRSNAD